MAKTIADVEQSVAVSAKALAELGELVQTIRLEHEVEISVLKEQMATQKASGEKWENRAWMFATALIISIFGAFLSLLGGSLALAIAVLKK